LRSPQAGGSLARRDYTLREGPSRQRNHPITGRRMITVEKLVKVFASGKRAVDGLDLEVRAGEIYALLGPNGAGKTTTIRVLSTLAGFDSGRVMVAGHDIDRAADQVRAAIGLVAQQTGVDFFLTGRENLHLQGQLYRMAKPAILARSKELADYFELNEALDRPVTTYSGGMRRKLDIATALMHHPKLLFLDEPTLGLDINSRKSLWRYVERMNRDLGLTILLTTHYLEEADKLSHRVAIINQGKICTVGTPEELKHSIGGDALTLTLPQRDPPAEGFAQWLTQQGIAKQTLWDGNRLHLYVSDGAASVPRVAAAASEQGLSIETLSLARPTLDDVFLRYTGTSLGENADSGGGDQWWTQWAGKGGGGKWAQQWQQGAEADTEAKSEQAWPNAEQWNQQTSAAQQNTPPAADAAAAEPADKQEAGQSGPWPSGAQSDSGETQGAEQDWKKWQQSGATQDWQKWQKK
jgi:ABC-2 type transport system ATP-binding protein